MNPHKKGRKTMATYGIKTSFELPITKEAGVKAIRLLDACRAALDNRKAFSLDVNGIYDDPERVPPDLVEQVRRIDPCPLGNPGFIVSYEETGQLWVRHEKSANLQFLIRYLQEVLQETGLGVWGFEYSADCSEPYVGAFGGGAIVITEHRARQFLTYDMLCILERKVTEEGESGLPDPGPVQYPEQGGSPQSRNNARKKLH
jgi:hypothetical protein